MDVWDMELKKLWWVVQETQVAKGEQAGFISERDVCFEFLGLFIRARLDRVAAQ